MLTVKPLTLSIFHWPFDRKDQQYVDIFDMQGLVNLESVTVTADL